MQLLQVFDLCSVKQFGPVAHQCPTLLFCGLVAGVNIFRLNHTHMNTPPEMNKDLGILLWLSNCMYESNLWVGKGGGDLLCLYLSSAHENWKQGENYMDLKFMKRENVQV